MNAIASITLCDVQITPTNQIDFANMQEQQNYFSSKSKHTYDKCRYQPRTATIKVKGYVDTLQNCNYGYYTNTYNGTSKTFYFWIVSKNYRAREVTELTIQIDVFQTWLFDFNFKPCFIEREHVNDDTYGRNTIPEDFELGDYLTYFKGGISQLMQDICFLVGVTDTSSGTIGGIYGATYSGYTLKYYKKEDYELLNNYITDLCNQGKGDSIAFIFAFPNGMLSKYVSSSGSNISSFSGILEEIINVNWDEKQQGFIYKGYSYIPHNNKIYTYPYSFITVKNASGSNVVLKRELFTDSINLQFQVDSVLTQHPTITITPLNYDGKEFAIDDSISLDDYGLCSWNNDNYANWFAQHQHSISAQSSNATASLNAKQTVSENNYQNALANRNTNSDKTALNTTLNALTSLGRFNVTGAVGSVVSGAGNAMLDYNQATANANNDLANSNLLNTTDYQNTISSLMASVQDAQVQPNTAKGSTASCGLDMARNTATFWVEQTAIKPEYAFMIDMYWQMFGYKVNRVGLPNLKSRQKWNYVKTVNCSIYGELPHEDADELSNIFNNGITIWHSDDYLTVHEYLQPNPIVTN